MLAAKKNIRASVATFPANAIATVLAIDPFHIVPSTSTPGIDRCGCKVVFGEAGAAVKPSIVSRCGERGLCTKSRGFHGFLLDKVYQHGKTSGSDFAAGPTARRHGIRIP